MTLDDYNMFTDGTKHSVTPGRPAKTFQSGYDILINPNLIGDN
jgi:hypothetical protein